MGLYPYQPGPVPGQVAEHAGHVLVALPGQQGGADQAGHVGLQGLGTTDHELGHEVVAHNGAERGPKQCLALAEAEALTRGLGTDADLIAGMAELAEVVVGVEHHDQSTSRCEHLPELGDRPLGLADVVEHVHGEDQARSAGPDGQAAGVRDRGPSERRCLPGSLQHPHRRVDADHRPAVTPAAKLGQGPTVPTADVHDHFFAGPDGEVEHGPGKVQVWALESVDGLAGREVRRGAVLVGAQVGTVRPRLRSVPRHGATLAMPTGAMTTPWSYGVPATARAPESARGEDNVGLRTRESPGP